MAWKKWGNFLHDIGKYFNSSTWQPAKPSNKFNSFYYFLTTHFCGYEDNLTEIDMRTLYSQEGARAATQAGLMIEAFKAVCSIKDAQGLSFYDRFQRTPSDTNLNHLSHAIIRAKPELGNNETTIDAINNYCALYAVNEWLDQHPEAIKYYDDFKKNPASKKTIIKFILDHYPQIRENNIHHPTQLIEKLLAEKIKWEIEHPHKKFQPLYLSQSTEYFSKTTANELAKSPNKSRRNLKEKVDDLSMPTFRNVIGIKILHPLYLLDAISSLLFEIPAKFFCWGINKIFGDHKQSSLAFLLKVLIAGPFIAAKVCTFSMAKISSPSGLKEIHHLTQSNRVRIQPARIDMLDVTPRSPQHVNQENSSKKIVRRLHPSQSISTTTFRHDTKSEEPQDRKSSLPPRIQPLIEEKEMSPQTTDDKDSTPGMKM